MARPHSPISAGAHGDDTWCLLLVPLCMSAKNVHIRFLPFGTWLWMPVALSAAILTYAQSRLGCIEGV
eukprot:12913291-Alexandrium_andersonii.AAC.1